MNVGWWVVLGVGGVVAIFLVMFVLLPAAVHRLISPALDRRVRQAYPSSKIDLVDLRAVTLGVQSKGVTQLRGNGALVLTDDVLHWFQLVPARDLRIPRAAITAVTTVRSHLGKSYGRDLLHVAYDADGQPDAAAWLLTDLPAWFAALSAPRSG